MTESSESYLCFVCLKTSEHRNVCTHCGAKIEDFDPNAAVVRPPQWGIFDVRFEDIPADAANIAVNKAISQYYQLAKVSEGPIGMRVRATGRGFEGFVRLVSDLTGTSPEDVSARVQFFPDQS